MSTQRWLALTLRNILVFNGKLLYLSKIEIPQNLYILRDFFQGKGVFVLEWQYTITPEDFIAFNRYFMLHHPRAKRNLIKDRVLGAILILAAGGLFGSLNGQFSALWIGTFVVCAAVYFGIAPKLMLNSMANRVRKMLKNASSSICGEKTFVIEDTGVRLMGEGENSEYAYSKIQKVITDTNCFYILVGEMEALIVPFTAFADTAARENFAKELQERVQQGGGKID